MDRLTPEQRARLDAFKAIKVKHPRLEEVDRAVTGAIEEHASSVYLLVYGPSGVGKSTVMRRVTERFASAEPNRSIVPVVLVEASSSDIGAYARLDYYRQVLTQLREHAAVKDRLVNIALSAKPTRNMRDVAEWLDIRDAVQYALQRLQRRFGWLTASLVLGVIWAGMHLPLWLLPDFGFAGQSIPLYVVQVAAISRLP